MHPRPPAAFTHQPLLLRTTAPAAELALRLPGQQLDEHAGQLYNLHRMYWPQRGRYTQPDPIGLEGGWNRFGYAEGDALNWMDPDGLQIRPQPALPRPTSMPWDPRLDRPAANDPNFGGGGGGGCDCERLRNVVNAMRSLWIRARTSPTMFLPMKFQIYVQYRAAVALYEGLCGPYNPPEVPPEPSRDKIDDFYSR